MRMKFIWTTTIALFIVSCSPKYASVYIKAIDKSSQSNVPMKVYSAKSGLYLGITPLSSDYKITNAKSDNFLSVVIEDDCYETKWKLVKLEYLRKGIGKGKVPSPIEINNILLEVVKKDSCK